MIIGEGRRQPKAGAKSKAPKSKALKSRALKSKALKSKARKAKREAPLSKREAWGPAGGAATLQAGSAALQAESLGGPGEA